MQCNALHFQLNLIRLDTLSGSLSVTSPRDRNDITPRCHSVSSNGNKTSAGAVVSRPFYDPIGEERDEGE